MVLFVFPIHFCGMIAITILNYRILAKINVLDFMMQPASRSSLLKRESKAVSLLLKLNCNWKGFILFFLSFKLFCLLKLNKYVQLHQCGQLYVETGLDIAIHCSLSCFYQDILSGFDSKCNLTTSRFVLSVHCLVNQQVMSILCSVVSKLHMSKSV